MRAGECLPEEPGVLLVLSFGGVTTLNAETSRLSIGLSPARCGHCSSAFLFNPLSALLLSARSASRSYYSVEETPLATRANSSSLPSLIRFLSPEAASPNRFPWRVLASIIHDGRRESVQTRSKTALRGRGWLCRLPQCLSRSSMDMSKECTARLPVAAAYPSVQQKLHESCG